MAQTFLVGVKGESYDNPDGTFRQEIIKSLRAGDAVCLIADPMNEHDRWAVGVFTKDVKQIGFLPSDARDASALLRGEPIKAVVEKLVGGTNWWSRTVQGKKHIGVVLRLTKGEPDWSRYTRLTEKAKPFDDAVKAARELEKLGDTDRALEAYREVVNDIAKLTETDNAASAHRREALPVDRLSLLLEKSKAYEEAIEVIDDWRGRFDPVQPTDSVRKSILKRRDRLQGKIG